MLSDDGLVHTVFLIFGSAALLATGALYARQALLVPYILAGMALGPAGLGLMHDAAVVEEISHVGIMFLLFLLGLDLPLHKLGKLLRETTLVTLASSLAFAAVGASVALGFGFTLGESLVVGATLMFSSTIIGLKLLPTTVLHHRRTGELIISVLLLQDLIAIAVLVMLQAWAPGNPDGPGIGLRLLALPVLVGVALLAERYVIGRLVRRWDKIREYIFLLAIGWCLGLAQLAATLGLSHEMGAFAAGVALAASPIAFFITDSLKPLRDFFLVLFFFALGARFHLDMLAAVAVPALVLTAATLLIKPPVFHWLFKWSGESWGRSKEIGARLGQISEFSLLVAVAAAGAGVIGERASSLIQVSALLSFVISPYLIVTRYPTPIAIKDELRRD